MCGYAGSPGDSRRRVLLAFNLPAQAKLLDQRTVTADVLAGQVLQQTPTAAHEQQQPATAVVVVLVHREVLVQVVDSPGQQRDLDLGRAGVTLIGRVAGDDLDRKSTV